MFEKNQHKFLGRVGLIEPIIISGKTYGLKVLPVYDLLRCGMMYKNLVNKLAEQGIDRSICEKVCEQACVVSMTLYNSNDERVFCDGLSVLRGLTYEELQTAYKEYKRFGSKFVKLDNVVFGIINKVKDGRFNFKADNNHEKKGNERA